MVVTIRSIDEFDRQIKRLSKKYHSLQTDLQIFVSDLRKNPSQGDDLGEGIRKVRMAIASKGKGKSGGARVITYRIEEIDDTLNLVLLTIYDKSEMESVSNSFIKSLINRI